MSMATRLTPRHASLARTAVLLALVTLLGSLGVGTACYVAMRSQVTETVLANNLSVAQVLASDLAQNWSPDTPPVSLDEMREHWARTEPLYLGSLQVVGSDGRILFDSRPEGEVGAFVWDRQLDTLGGGGTIGDLARTGEDWVGLRDNVSGEREAIAFAAVAGYDALVAVRVPYEIIAQDVRDTSVPWVSGLALVALVIGPLSVGVLHHAYRLALAETALAEASQRRLASRLGTLQRVDRAVLGASTPREVALAALEGIAAVVPVARGAVVDERRRMLACIPAEAGEDWLRQPLAEPLLQLPLRAGDSDVGTLIIDVRHTDALTREHRDVLREVGDGLAIALRQARLADEIAKHAATLEAHVTSRTAQLQDVVRELESFTYTVAHDLRAPLRTMAGLAELVQLDHAETLLPEGREYLVQIAGAAERMDRLVIDLLEYSRVGRDVYEARDVDLGAALALAADTVGATGELEVAKPLPAVLANDVLLGQVLRNLLSNAVKFTLPGVPPRIRVWAEATDGVARVYVADNGIGFEPEHRDRIFRMFERLHRVGTYPGTGVGLALVRRAVERLDGRVGVESRPGAGSTFWFEVPLTKERQDHAKDRTAR